MKVKHATRAHDEPSSLGLAKVPKLDLVGTAVRTLREAVVSGRIPAGTRITEMRLAAEMDISRSTLRTALLELEKEDLVVRTPFSSWAVPEPTPEMIWEVYTLRMALESLAVRLVTENLNASREAAIREAFASLEIAEQSDLSDAERMRIDLKFHETIVAQSGHQRLRKHYGILLNKIASIYAWVDATQSMRIDLPEWHRPIFDAIVRRQPDAAEKAVSTVLTTAYHGLSKAITEDSSEGPAP